ncbi:MAG: hypothetical protein FJ404_02915 [Verrucomicrobia bacterium]|nr:hypothetical protein [Verrucomicrobiota bacterium]
MSLRGFFRTISTRIVLGVLAVWLSESAGLRGQTLDSAVTPLPPLTLRGVPARAHTQGIDWSGPHLFVTARRDDVTPRRALLLRTGPGRADWDSWDLTRKAASTGEQILDHPGGFQISRGILWVPLSTSTRAGPSQIHAYRVASLRTNGFARPEVTFPVDDHIGALAVLETRKLLLGASWDTQRVFVWNFQGVLQRILTAADLAPLELGFDASAPSQAGLAVQDWKFLRGRLHAVGLRKGGDPSALEPKSLLMVFEDFLESTARKQAHPLRPVQELELGREGFSIKGEFAYFLPEDLGASNRLFRAKIPGSLQPAPAADSKP